MIKISAPATATGDEEGRLTLTLALESDPDVTVVGVLPVEANRTRGLSILGPEGLPESEGSGSPDQWRWRGSWSKILVMRLRARYCVHGVPLSGAMI